MDSHDISEHRPKRGRRPWAPYHEPTRPMRIPISRIEDVRRFLAHAKEEPQRLEIPMFESPAPQAGFPSPAADAIEGALDLNELLIRNPPATFFLRAAGESMRDAGITTGDILIVDRSMEAVPGKIVIATYDGDIFVKRLRRFSNEMVLASENSSPDAVYPDMPLAGHDVVFWGVVTSIIRRLMP